MKLMDDPVQSTFIKVMSPEDMIVLINDKFLNWKALLSDIIQKKIE